MKSIGSISIGIVVLLLFSACSSSLPRPPAMQPVPSGIQSGPRDTQAESVQSTRGASSQGDIDSDMRRRGYKPASYHGERVYCRNETLTGSNLASKVCLTAKQIDDQERAAKDVLNATRPAGCIPGQACN